MTRATLIPVLVSISLLFTITATQVNATGSTENLLFSWDPTDNSSAPNHLVVVSGSFTRMGLLSDTTTDVEGEFEGKLKENAKDESTTTVTSTAGTTTITTTVNAHSRNVNNFKGQIAIDGEVFDVKLKTPTRAQLLEVLEEITGPSTQNLNQDSITIPVLIKMVNEDKDKFTGFGIIRQEISLTTVGTDSITFATDEFEAEVIGEDGLFKLNLSKLERIVETVP